MTEERMLTTTEAAQMLGYTRTTPVYNLIARGQVRATKATRIGESFPGARRTWQVWVIPESEIRRYRETTPPARQKHPPGCTCWKHSVVIPRCNQRDDCGCPKCISMDLQPIQIGLTTDQKGRVDRWAKRLAMSRAELVRTAVECYLSDMEADDA